jgi:DNA-binding NtrC family response regulator/tetratricopeptide (TPR) repeat protein
VAPSTVQAALARAASALERGRGAEAVQILLPYHRSGTLPRDEELSVRARMAEAYLLQDDLTQAAAALGRPPDVSKESLPDARLSTLWRLHGRLAFERSEQSRAIALHTRALKFAEQARESHLIGLAHYELAMCYKRVGDSAIVREHLTEAANALHAAGDKRHLALVHRLMGVLLGQEGRNQEATTALRLAERLATSVHADDVLAGTAHNQAILALMSHRLDEALALAERSVALYRALGEGHGLAVTLATLGQVFVQIGDLERAEDVLMKALEVRKPVQFHVTTGAVFDTLAQIHLMRGTYDRASEYLRQAGEAYGSYGTQTGKWYEWSVKVLETRLAVRRGAFDDAIARANELVSSPDIPPSDAVQADLAACEALLELGRVDEAAQRLKTFESRFDPRTSPANWGEFLRVRGELHARTGQQPLAYHDFAQSVNIFDLLGERYQTAVAHLAVARLAASTGARTTAERSLELATPVFQMLGARRDLDDVAAVRRTLDATAADGERTIELAADDAFVTRLTDAAILPDLLAREIVTTVQDITGLSMVVAFVASRGSDPRVLASCGGDRGDALALARAAADGCIERNGMPLLVAPLDKAADGPRFCVATGAATITPAQQRRFRLLTAVARQGFELCGLRERPAQATEQQSERTLEPLLPGFICASAAMARVTDQIQRVQGQTLTVLITGESGTGKDLIARAIHAGSPRRMSTFLPFNCTTMTRDLADSQLFGHRRGSFTGAMTDQQGLIRSAAGGTLFLDEIGDVPLDVQPKLLRFLEQGEILPIGETRPQAVDVRVLAATNADLEQRVAEGKFREDLYYRLSVIRIEVPPLRARREEIPHLSTFFLRESCEKLAKPEVTLSSATLDVFARYHWPGNVRQLWNEIQRAVAMSPAGGIIEPEHLSPDLSVHRLAGAPVANSGHAAWTPEPGTLAENIEKVERTIIMATLEKTGANISEAARLLGLTRKGLYMKMARLGLSAVVADIK